MLIAGPKGTLLPSADAAGYDNRTFSVHVSPLAGELIDRRDNTYQLGFGIDHRVCALFHDPRIFGLSHRRYHITRVFVDSAR